MGQGERDSRSHVSTKHVKDRKAKSDEIKKNLLIDRLWRKVDRKLGKLHIYPPTVAGRRVTSIAETLVNRTTIDCGALVTAIADKLGKLQIDRLQAD